MKRVAFKMHLNEGQKEIYKKRHQEISSELKALLKQAGVYEYSIFFNEETNTLFAFQKVEEGKGDSQQLGENPLVKSWWKFMVDIMKVNPDHSPVTEVLEEVFYMP